MYKNIFLLLEITSNNKKDFMPLMQKIYDTIGQPRNYGPSGQEEQEEQREDDVEERIRREALEKAEEERRASQWKEWVRSMGGIQAWTVRGVIAGQRHHIIIHRQNLTKITWFLPYTFKRVC